MSGLSRGCSAQNGSDDDRKSVTTITNGGRSAAGCGHCSRAASSSRASRNASLPCPEPTSTMYMGWLGSAAGLRRNQSRMKPRMTLAYAAATNVFDVTNEGTTACVHAFMPCDA